jgi:hypothetical protein
MCEVGSRKNGQEPKKKEKKSIVVSSKKKSTMMSPIRRQMKKRNPSGGQNGQLVHWWVLIHSGRNSTTPGHHILPKATILPRGVLNFHTNLRALPAGQSEPTATNAPVGRSVH